MGGATLAQPFAVAHVARTPLRATALVPADLVAIIDGAP
jgi:hypothetical protein